MTVKDRPSTPSADTQAVMEPSPGHFKSILRKSSGALIVISYS